MNDSVDMHLKGPVIVDNVREECLDAAIRLSHWCEEARGLGQLQRVSRRKVISKGMASSGPISGGPRGQLACPNMDSDQWMSLKWQTSSSRAVDFKVLHYGLDSRRYLDFGDEYHQGQGTALS